MAITQRANNKTHIRPVIHLAGIILNVLGRVFRVVGLRALGNMIVSTPAQSASETESKNINSVANKPLSVADYSDDRDTESGNPSPAVETSSKKSVRFNNAVKVVLVATKKEYFEAGLYTELWREPDEHDVSRAEVKKEFELYKATNPNSNLRTFLNSISSQDEKHKVDLPGPYNP